MQDERADKTVEAQSGGGMVTCVGSMGNRKFCP